MTSSPAQPPAATHLERSDGEQRRAKLRALAEAGFPPYGAAFPDTRKLADLREGFQEGLAVRAAGRLMTLRDMGKSVFADLSDGSGRFQLYAAKAQTEAFDIFKQLLDAGDLIGVEGALFTTRMGELTIRLQKWTLLAKALRPLPEKWHGLKDVEIRYRQRYLDLIANPEVRRLFDRRAQVVRAIREFLWAKGFCEVETPMMQAQAGGAAARPFKTHHAALNAEMVLRIAPELYLKRLLVGGFDKLFELNRNFRNEGLSRTHNPEFTMLEVYQAWSDRSGMQALVQELITTVAEKLFGAWQGASRPGPGEARPGPGEARPGPGEARPGPGEARPGPGEARPGPGEARPGIDLTPPWREVAYRDLILEKAGADWYGLAPEAARARATSFGLVIDPAWSLSEITHEIFEKLVERTLQKPTFVTRLPRELVPLAKVCADDPNVVDVFELIIGGQEIAPGYSELNDPLEQRARLAEQSGETAQKVDEDFLLALEHGMPPSGGLGLGVDRLVMILTGAEAIRDVILFPQLRPKAIEETQR